jgi:hypothetical protein
MAALTSDSSATGCPATLLVAQLCRIEACKACGDPQTYTECQNFSIGSGGVCESSWGPTAACLASIDSGVKAICLGSSSESPIDFARKLGMLFCGAGVGDAGTDAMTSDARSDAPSGDGG